MLFVFLALAVALVHCSPVEVALRRKDMPTRFTVQLVQRTTANFGAAYKQACGAGMLKSRPLIPVNGANAGKLFLINAPNANVASIFPGNGRMVLEYPFVEHGGKMSVPSGRAQGGDLLRRRGRIEGRAGGERTLSAGLKCLSDPGEDL